MSILHTQPERYLSVRTVVHLTSHFCSIPSTPHTHAYDPLLWTLSSRFILRAVISHIPRPRPMPMPTSDMRPLVDKFTNPHISHNIEVNILDSFW